MTLSSISSRPSAFSGWPSQSVHAQNFSRIHAACPAGGVRQAVAERLRAGGLLLGIARVPVVVVLRCCEGQQLLVVGLTILRPAAAHHHVQVDADAGIRVTAAQRARHGRSPVAALGAEAVVAQAGHELGPAVGDLCDAPARLGRLAAEAVAGQRRADHVECVGCVPAVGDGVGQWLDDLRELDHRPGPAVGDHDRHRIGLGRTNVDEVHVHAADVGHELVKTVQCGFARPPVVGVGPVVADLLEVRQRDPLGPVVDRLGFGPPRARQSVAKVAELFVWDGDLERFDTHAAHGSPQV